jgi:outer membrane protein assembly factor BamB
MHRLAALVLPALLAASAAGAAPVKHRFACADYSGGKVFFVSADGKVEWEHPAPKCNELWVLPNGNILFTTGRGVLELTRDKQKVFEYKSKSEIYACQRLPNGNTFVGECSTGRLLELDPKANVVKEVKLLPGGKKGGHAFMRNARVLKNGNYLVAHYGPGCVREYDPQGKQVMEIPAPGGPHSCARLPDGNTLVATGDHKGPKACKVFEVDPKGKLVWEITNADLPEGVSFKFMTGFHRLANGNTVMSNWVGHGQFGKAPHIIEVTRDKKVVWTFNDHETMRTCSSVQILDTPADAIQGEVLH